MKMKSKKQKCWLCEKKNPYLIKDYDYWRLSIHPNQYYLGRCVISLKKHLEDITEINNCEKDELFNIMKNLRKAITNSFGADLFNYASLGNITRHAHVHFIPRYEKEVEFYGFKFKDENWNKNYAPYPKDFETQEKILNAIKQEIISQL